MDKCVKLKSSNEMIGMERNFEEARSSERLRGRESRMALAAAASYQFNSTLLHFIQEIGPSTAQQVVQMPKSQEYTMKT